MSLELSGVRLVAENASQFLSTMRAGDAAMASFASATSRAASDTAAFARATQQIKLDGLNNQLRDQQTRLGILKQQLSDTAAKYGEASTQAQTKAAAVARLSGQVGITEQKIGLLAQQMAAEADAAQRGTGSNQQLAGSLGTVAGSARTAESALQQIATGALRQIGAFGVQAFGRLTDAAVSFVRDGVGGLADYERAMSVLQATSGANADQMARVAATAKALGADLTLPATSAGSAASAMNDLVQAGLSIEDAMDGARGALQLAAAGMVSDGEAAEYIAAALNQFGLAGNQATRVADLMAASISAAGSKVGQTGQAIQQAGASFAAANIPIEVLITSIDLMAKAGIKGSDAGTSLKTMLQRLQSPTTAAASTLKDLGISIYDAQGAMRPMREIVGQFSQALSGLSQQRRAEAINTIFGADAQRAANIVLAGGVAAYDAMAAAVVRQGAAADQAAAQMQGIGGAAKALQSGLETLALNGLEPLAPLMISALQAAGAFVSDLAGKAGPAMTRVAATLTAVGQGSMAVADAVRAGLVPALGAATAAAIVYAAVNAGQMGIALAIIVQRVTMATSAFLANAAAVAAAALPYALIAAAIGGVILAYKTFDDKIKASAQDVLNSRQWWQDSAKALTDYGTASTETQTRLSAHAATIRELRSEIQGELEDLGRRMAAGQATDAQYQQELATINAKRAGLIEVTAAMEQEIAASVRQQAASMTGSAAMQQAGVATQQFGAMVNLTADELKQLGDALEQTYQKGAQAVEQYVTTEQTFLAQANEARRTGNAQALSDQAARYAAEQAAQSAHLGQMLMDYTATQVAMGNISAETAQTIAQGIEQQFGVAQDASSRTFLQMTADIDHFASSGSSSASTLAGALSRTMGTAQETRTAMEALAKKYEAELIENFNAGKINAQQLAAELRAIPSKVYSEVIITEKRYTSGAGDHVQGGGVSGTRATGGPVALARAYLVGEQGPEVFVPNSNGYIIPNHQLRGARAAGGPVLGPVTTTARVGSQLGRAGDATDWAAALADVVRQARGGNSRGRTGRAGGGAGTGGVGTPTDPLAAFLAAFGGTRAMPRMSADAAAALAGRNTKLEQIERDGAEQLRTIDAWYADQQRQLIGNPETLATLKQMYAARVATARVGLEQQRQAELQAAEQQRRDRAQQAAEQAAAQQRQQGQALISYIQEEAKKKPALKAQSDALIAQIRAQYGIEEDLLATSLDAQKQRLAAFFAGGGTTDPAALATALANADRSAGQTASTRQALSEQFTTAFQQQFKDGQIGQAELTNALLTIPSLVTQALAGGYKVPGMGGAAASGNWQYQDNRSYQMPIYTNQSPAALSQGYYTMRALIL